MRRGGAGPGLTRTLLGAWTGSVLVLVVGGAGLFALTSSSTSTSVVRMGLAAGVLALLSSLAAVVLVPRETCAPLARACCGLLVPGLVGAGSALFVGAHDGAVPALLAGLPWLVGGLAGAGLSPFLGELRRPELLRRRSR